MQIVCISGKAQHGKDTFGAMLRDELEARGNYVLVTHFAWLVKEICKEFFLWNGEKDEAGRTLLQYVGTDKVRKKRPDFWVNFVTSILELFPDEWDYVIIPDCRFPNEVDCFPKHGFDTTLVRVSRPWFDNGLTEQQKNHPSETALDDYVPDFMIQNSGTFEDLRMQATVLADYLEGVDPDA